MVSISNIAVLDFALGSLAGLALLYLLYAETMVVHYRRFFRLITFGLLVYAVTGPIVGSLAPAYIHLIHGTATLFIALGLYDLVREDLEHTDDFERVLTLDEPRERAARNDDADGGFADDDQ